MKLRLSALAQEQYTDVLTYTLERFGSAQVDLYEARIQRALETLLAYPESGYRVDDVEPGIRAFSVARHRIFYQLSDEYIDVLALLHESQLPQRFLGE